MKKFLLITTLFLISFSGIIAQVTSPAGMRYQAIARDSDGNIRSEEPLTVKAELMVLDATEEVVYSEIHNTASGEFGLLNITIGEGESIKGSFSDVPWYKHVWVRISIKNSDNEDFQLVTTSKLYSVPYAFYAATAGEIVDKASEDEGGHEGGNRSGEEGMNSMNWTLEGNYDSQERNDGNPVLGTTDANDLVIVTNNVPRITISQEGQTEFMVNVDVDGDLNVDGTTTLNSSLDVTGMSPTHLTGTLTVDKPTTLNDALTVTNTKPTHLTGSLDVDGTLNADGATTLNNTLDVTGMSATHLSGTLTVDKETTLNDDLSVENNAPTHLTGLLDVDETLNVDGATTLNNTLDVTGMSATHLSGTLTVDKETTLNDDLSVENMASSHLTGSLDVDLTLNVDGATTLNNTLDVTGGSATHLSGTLTVDEATTLNDDLSVENMASSHLTGSLDVDLTLNVDGATTLNNTLEVTGGSATELSGTLQVDQATTLNDDLTVENAAPSHLTGSLDVDQTLNVDGATTLNNTLNVTGMSATTLSGTLTVGQETTLNDDLTVANMAPTHLTGSLSVDGAFDAGGEITLDGALEVTGMHPTHLTGTLEVDKLATMDAGLHVSGNGTLGPNGDHVAFFDNTEGGNSDGVAIRIQNNSASEENNFVTFYKGGNGVAGRIEGFQFSDIGSPPIPTEDEIWSAVCIVIADYNPLTIFWTQFANQFNLVGTIWNGATIPAFALPDFPGLELPNFPGVNMPTVPGVDMPTFPGLALPTFDGVSIPDIPSISVEGVEIFPGLTLPNVPSVNIPDVPSFNIPDVPSFDILDVPAFVIPDIPPFVVPDVPEIDLSEDFFVWPTIPTFSDILVAEGVCPNINIFSIPNGYVYRLIEWGVENDMQSMISFNPIDLATKAATWAVQKAAKVGGVTYGSKGADYAEYLPKLYPTEQFLNGEIVGIHGGRISKVTTGADQILAISTRPLVLGNQPDEAEKDQFEKVGFLGQVPVYVQGPVELGDYIVPSGKNDGIGKAIKASELSADILPEIFGKAWSSSPLATTVIINVSIGLRPTEIAEVLQQREESLKFLQEQINLQNSIHASLKEDVNMLKAHLDIEGKSSTRRSN